MPTIHQALSKPLKGNTEDRRPFAQTRYIRARRIVHIKSLTLPKRADILKDNTLRNETEIYPKIHNLIMP